MLWRGWGRAFVRGGAPLCGQRPRWTSGREPAFVAYASDRAERDNRLATKPVLGGTWAANTPIRQLVILPAEPVYRRPTMQNASPCLRTLVSLITSTASAAAKRLTMHSRTMSRSASVSQGPRSRMVCLPPQPRISCRLGPHPACLTPFRPQQVVQEQPSRRRNTRLGEQLPDARLGLRNDDTRSFSTVSIEAPAIHDPRTTANHKSDHYR